MAVAGTEIERVLLSRRDGVARILAANDLVESRLSNATVCPVAVRNRLKTIELLASGALAAARRARLARLMEPVGPQLARRIKTGCRMIDGDPVADA